VIEILILGVLRNGPVHGYELKRRVQRPTLRPLSNNSLYPLLKRFEERGAVTHRSESAPGRPARKVYAITEAGHALFHELITTLTPDEAGQDEDFLLRVGFFDEMSRWRRRPRWSPRCGIPPDGAAARCGTSSTGWNATGRSSPSSSR
jgi:DNA-binding PadR family transcriptional regulator